nr:hypothetical protein [Fundidesulfovibrio terrae]
MLGVFLSPELWAKAQAEISPAIDKALEELDPSTVKIPPEPMKDWELLAQYWDFQYELPVDVSCEHCGSSTQDWQKDEPRKFRLRTATLGGLANFECQKCRSRIIKKHFKNKVDVECRPYVEK